METETNTKSVTASNFNHGSVWPLSALSFMTKPAQDKFLARVLDSNKYPLKGKENN